MGADKLGFIFHPYHIYSVSQQFVYKEQKNKSKDKKSKKKGKDEQVKCYKLNTLNMDDTTKGYLDKSWKKLQPDIKEMQKQNQTEKFNGSEHNRK